MAASVVEIFAPLLREEEQAEAFAQVFARIKAGVECLEIQSERMRQRMRPSRN